MREGMTGTMLVGLILILSGLSYLDNIINYAGPVNWEQIRSGKLEEYKLKTDLLIREENSNLLKQGIQPFLRDAQLKDLQGKNDAGKTNMGQCLEGVQRVHANYLFMRHPEKLFVFLFISEWLLVAGIGCVLLFPWSRRFVFLSLFLSFFWQTYLFLYDKAIREAFFSCDVQASQLLNTPMAQTVKTFPDPAALNQVLHTFIFLGLIVYLTSSRGRQQFSKKKPKTLVELFSE